MWWSRFGGSLLLPDLECGPPFEGPPIVARRLSSEVLEVWSGDLGREACCDGLLVLEPSGELRALCLSCARGLDCLAGERALFEPAQGLPEPSSEHADRGHLPLSVELPFLALLRPAEWKRRSLDRMHPGFSLGRIRSGLARLRRADFRELSSRPDICWFAGRRHFPAAGMEASFQAKLRRLRERLDTFSSDAAFRAHVRTGGR